jgi:hypothetical protein
MGRRGGRGIAAVRDRRRPAALAARAGAPLTQAASRLVCCLFWFVPLVWFANWFLYAEQEKACDSGAVERGVQRRDYASCLLFAAQVSPAPSAIAGLYSPLWRRRILEDRIRNVMTPAGARRGWLVPALASLLIGVLLLLGGASARIAPPNAGIYQRFVGSWENTEYAGTPEQAQVTVVKPGYAGEDWLTPDSESPVARWKFIVKKTWVDEKGNTNCQYIAPSAKNPGWLNAWLMRVDKARKVIEFQWGSAETSESALRFPETIEPEDPMYSILYRKE